MRTAPTSVDEYLAAVASEEFRAELLKLRAIVLDEVPEAEEVISYGIPTYKLRGMLCSFAAFKNHCSFFPGHTLDQFLEEVSDFKTSRGTVQFTPSHPLPESLVRAIVRARLAENLAKAK